MKSLVSSTFILITLITLSGSFLSGCSNAPTSSNKAGTVKKQTIHRVQNATVTEVKTVMVVDPKANTRVLGPVGSIAGSIAASGSYGASLIGSLIGGALGSSADKGLSKKPGVEIGLKLQNGESVVVTQLVKEDTTFKAGDRVKLVQNDAVAVVQRL